MSLIRRIVIVLLGLVILLAGLLFSLHNNQMVEIDFLIYKSPEFYLSFWLIAAFVAGGLIGVTVSGAAIVKLKLGKRRTDKKIRRTEGEVSRLKDRSL